MPKYIIKWNIGYGESAEAVEAKSIEDAKSLAYEQAREEFENSAEYDAVEWSEDEAENYGLDTEHV